MSTQTQTNTCVSSSPQPESDPCFLTAQDQRADCQQRAQSRGLIDSQGQPLGPLPPPTRPHQQMAGTTDTSGYPGPPPGDNPQGEDDDSNHRNQSSHPSHNNSLRRSTGSGSGRPPDDGDGDNSDGGPPADPPPDGNNPNNLTDDVRCELQSLLSSGSDSSSVRAPDLFDGSDPNKLKILLDNFSSTFPEEEAEMALEKLAFPNGSWVTKYFIQFANTRPIPTLVIVPTDASPTAPFQNTSRIVSPTSHPNPTVMKISNTLFSNSMPVTGNTKSNNTSGNAGESSGNNKSTYDKGKTKQKSTPANDISSELGPNSKLLPAECQ
ncbi:hypothetical protein M422DRAFT_247151 [Sphaerobolus stellatus SS14]|nr:hypothetical protein M422DRAFT_247151 [Sphaerobolus stellatus SS14]